jgi:hypothetical protein
MCYCAAMERIEQRLNVGLSLEQDHAETPVDGSERAQLFEVGGSVGKA